jgi:hypothetical protein
MHRERPSCPFSLSAQSDHFADRLLLGLMWDELGALAETMR